MLINQVSFNSSYPLGNIFYVYLINDKKLDNIARLLHKTKIINIQITTTVLENVTEGLILPKKYSENGI